MFLFIMVIKIIFVIGEEVKFGLIIFNGKKVMNLELLKFNKLNMVLIKLIIISVFIEFLMQVIWYLWINHKLL